MMIDRIVVGIVFLLISAIVLLLSNVARVDYISAHEQKNKADQKQDSEDTIELNESKDEVDQKDSSVEAFSTAESDSDNDNSGLQQSDSSELTVDSADSPDALKETGEAVSAKKERPWKKFLSIFSISKIREAARDSKRFLITASIVYFVFCFLLTFFSNGSSHWIKVFQALIFFEIVFTVSNIDKQIKKIPNQFIIFLIAVRIPCMIVEIVLAPSLWLSTILSPLIGFVAGGLIVLVFMLISRGGIGSGDMKLIAVTGFYFGLVGMVELMFYSMILASLTSIVLLISRKAKFKSSLPMAPFICIGSALYIIFAFVRFAIPV